MILLTNDDGFYSEGIESLFFQLAPLGEIYIVAPDRERSASSLSLTLHHPLRIVKIKKNVYAVDGTPADCVYMAIKELLPRKPDLLISGLNQGPNLGHQDISYSGTVAGALQGTFLQVPSIAISIMPDEKENFFYDLSSKIAYKLAEEILEKGLPPRVTLNINIPPPPHKGLKITKLGQKRYNPEIISKSDPRKRIYYWIGTGTPKAIGGIDSDVMIIKKGYISITPLHSDLTDYKTIIKPEFKKFIKSLTNEII